MARRSSRLSPRRLDRLVAPAALFTLVLVGSVPAAAADLILLVSVNGRPQDGFGEFVEHDGRLLARRDRLAEVGIALPPGVPEEAGGLVPLDEVPSLAYVFDASEQTVAFDVAPELLAGSSVSAGPKDAFAQAAPEATTALVFNYDATVRQDSIGGTSWSSALGGRLSTPWGVAETTGFVRGGAGQETDAVRLESWAETYLPGSMIRLRAGDAVTAGLSWTRPIRFGGLVARRDFAMRPDLVTQPLMTFTGTAEVPSTVDVLIDGASRGSYDVEPGPFRISDLPSVTGGGDVTLVVRDALGRERLETFPYYASPSVLAAGLFDWSLEGGLIRTDYGIRSFGYGAWMASATARWGATDWLTLEAHAEGTAALASGGIGAVVGLGALGAVSGFGGLSRGDSGDVGARAGAAYEWSNSWLRLSLQAEAASPAFADVASLEGSDVPSTAWRAGAGLDLDAYGTLGFSYVHRTFQDSDAQSVLTASYALPLWDRMRIGLSSFASPEDGDWRVMGTFSMPLGGAFASLRTRADEDGWQEATAQLSETATEVGEVGWQVLATRGTIDRLYASADVLTPYGDLSARGDAIGDDWGLEVGARGAVVAAPAGLFPARRIDSAFAIVDVRGAAGVPILFDNRPVGETGWFGAAIVPNLRPWQENALSIDALAVPLDLSLGNDRRTVVPAGSAGVLVEFGGATQREIVVALVDETGVPLPMGAAVTVDGHPASFPMGRGGEAFVAAAADAIEIEVSGLWGRCVAEAEVPEDPPPRLGPLTCRKIL